jgi:uncharacterized membrane protein HdeD (DUF308 family)
MIEQVGKAGAVLRKGASDLCNRAWWVFLIGGIASVVFGILAFVNPGAAWLVLSMFFAAWVLVDGAVNIWGALSNRDKDGWWAILLLGVAGVLAGGYALLNPPVSMMVFVYVVAFIAMFIGITSLYLGWRIRREIPNEWILYLSGALSVLFALLILFNPEVGGLSVVYLIASWAIVIGVLRIWFATRVRKLRDRIGTTVAS